MKFDMSILSFMIHASFVPSFKSLPSARTLRFFFLCFLLKVLIILTPTFWNKMLLEIISVCGCAVRLKFFLHMDIQFFQQYLMKRPSFPSIELSWNLRQKSITCIYVCLFMYSLFLLFICMSIFMSISHEVGISHDSVVIGTQYHMIMIALQ